MNLRRAAISVRVLLKTQVLLFPCAQILFLLLSLGQWQPVCAQPSRAFAPVTNAPLSTKQVVENLVGMNLERAKALHAYRGTRIYRVEYRGFSGARSAEMIVNIAYQSPGTKDFTIQSVTGSKIIIDKVFRRLLEAEREALTVEAQQRTALNSENYDFTLVGYESTPSGSMYVLVVEPKTKDKFLYRGRIWVDAEDFAVVRLEAEPAKDPSFWTKKSEIQQIYTKVNNFWLPNLNHSITAIRLGGHAELTIQYNNYQITGADPVKHLSMPESARLASTGR